MQCGFVNTPRGCQKFHFDNDNDFLDLPLTELAKMDKFVNMNKKMITYHTGFGPKDRKKEGDETATPEPADDNNGENAQGDN